MDVEADPAAGLSIRQLALPLASAPAPPRPAAGAETVTPTSVWSNLSPAARQQLERTVRRVLAEVVRDADHG